MPNVTYELTVDVGDVILEDQSIVEAAEEILSSAPSYDGIDDEVIGMLDVRSIVPEMFDPIEVGNVYEWESGQPVYITAISIAEDGSPQVRISDHYSGEAEDRTVTAGDIIERVVGGELTLRENEP